MMVAQIENSRLNGIESPAAPGGKGGGPLPTSTDDGRHTRSDLALLERAARKGWDVPDDLLTKLPDVAVKIALDANAGARERLRAVECVRAMVSDNVAAAVALDKVTRLDDGRPTENVGHRVYSIEFDRNG